MQVPFKLCEGNINLSHTKPCLKKPRHLGMLTFFKQGLNADQMETEICETGLRQARRFAQRIMERYGQGKQRSMAQFRPQRLPDFDCVLGSVFLTGKAAFKLALSRYPDEAVQGRCVSEFHRVPKKACRSIAETHRLLGRVKKLL